MGRLFFGEKQEKAAAVAQVLVENELGLREMEIAAELGWERKTVNNYLHELVEQKRVYKDGRLWFAEES
jgi:DNA-binding IclR family transcriptional regulator